MIILGLVFTILKTVIVVIPFVLFWYLKSNKKETNPEKQKELDAFFEEDDDSLDYD